RRSLQIHRSSHPDRKARRALPRVRPNKIGLMNFSRRGFLRCGLLAGVAKVLPAYSQASKAPLFIEVPASTSGITWVHENGMSANRYLPEALGPGCAFL